MDKQKKLARLQKKESNLVYKGKKAVDEGRDNRADRLLKRAAKVENRVIKTSEKMKDGGPTGIQKIRREILTKRINNLNDKGIENQIAGNKKKALKQFDKSDKLHQRRSDIRQKAAYKKGGVTKSTVKEVTVKTKKK
jgi:hypothetical protein